MTKSALLEKCDIPILSWAQGLAVWKQIRANKL